MILERDGFGKGEYYLFPELTGSRKSYEMEVNGKKAGKIRGLHPQDGS